MDLSSLEDRLKHVEGTVVSDLEREAHTKIGQVLLEAGRELVALLPDGPEAESIVETLVSAAQAAHSIIHAAAAASDPAAAAPTTTDLPGVPVSDTVATDLSTDASAS